MNAKLHDLFESPHPRIGKFSVGRDRVLILHQDLMYCIGSSLEGLVGHVWPVGRRHKHKFATYLPVSVGRLACEALAA